MYFSDLKLEAINTVKRFSNFGFPYVIAPAFSTPAFSTHAIYSRIFHSCIFHSRIFSAPTQASDDTAQNLKTLSTWRLLCDEKELFHLDQNYYQNTTEKT